MRVALAYNLKRTKPGPGGAQDEEAEYDGPTTVQSVADAILSLGHDLVLLEADRGFPRALLEANADVVFNMAEGARGRSREAQVPALLEMLGVPYTGSDAACLVLTLDKAAAKSIVRDAGVHTTRGVVMTTGAEPLPPAFSFPAVVKPVAEGSSKGVLPSSVARTETEARALARTLQARYRQGALVEEYLPGREFTLAVLGDPPVVLAPMEIVFSGTTEHPVYSFDHKLQQNSEVRYVVPADVSQQLGEELAEVALRSFEALGCRDVARVDMRLDASGRPAFIECNPLPGLTPGWSDLCLIADAHGLDYRMLIATILEPATARRSAIGHGAADVIAKVGESVPAPS